MRKRKGQKPPRQACSPSPSGNDPPRAQQTAWRRGSRLFPPSCRGDRAMPRPAESVEPYDQLSRMDSSRIRREGGDEKVSRGPGQLQRRVLDALDRQPEKMMSLHRLKGQLYGWALGRKLMCTPTQASSVSRTISSLQSRGLVHRWVEWRGRHAFVFLRLAQRATCERHGDTHMDRPKAD